MKPHTDPKLLDNASQLLFHFNRMPRILQRMECHEIAFSWANGANAAASQLGIIECACTELGRSQEPMQQLLSIVLSIGNYLNGGTARGEVRAKKITKTQNIILILGKVVCAHQRCTSCLA